LLPRRSAGARSYREAERDGTFAEHRLGSGSFAAGIVTISTLLGMVGIPLGLAVRVGLR
jgi:hypothetical protein